MTVHAPAVVPRSAAAERPADGVLVVGYGSTLRGDDGVGPRAAEMVAGDPRLAGATVLVRHQLTPELAADIAAARLVVLVDARADASPGSVSVERVAGAASSVDPVPAARAEAGATTHHVGAAEVAALARDLWGTRPEVLAVGVGAASFEVGDGLSVSVERALPRVVDAIAAIVGEHGRA
ncbi:MAG: hydrogenase maturation protease [Chloroflexi bacterium]|nr:hydrogenase maturation protease [Chloroflexota bacterium]